VRWVARAGAEGTLGELAQALGLGGAAALAEGRVFVDGRRVLDPELSVPGGSVVEVHRARVVDEDVSVLAEHAGFIFVDKPPGIATEPDHAGIEASLLARVARRLGVPMTELHALSRLDVGVSGVVTLARTAEARELALSLRTRGAWLRRYVAIARGAPEPSAGTWDEAIPRQRAGSTPAGEERAAATRYALVASAGPVFLPSRAGPSELHPALLALGPITGRTHQLRVHAAGAGVPLLGDATYGGPARFALGSGSVRALERVALHAAWVEFELEGRALRITSAWPAPLVELWRTLGGSDDDWERAAALAL
jgi:23S rRNA-/tRNA-specific pseudouridylate synthase